MSDYTWAEECADLRKAYGVMSDHLQEVCDDLDETAEKYNNLLEDYNYLVFRLNRILKESDTSDSCLMKIYDLLEEA